MFRLLGIALRFLQQVVVNYAKLVVHKFIG